MMASWRWTTRVQDLRHPCQDFAASILVGEICLHGAGCWALIVGLQGSDECFGGVNLRKFYGGPVENVLSVG